MTEDEQLEVAVQDLLLDLCEVLYKRGYTEIPLGPLMRVVGVPEEKAAQHDGSNFELDDSFRKLIEMRNAPTPKRSSKKVVLH